MKIKVIVCAILLGFSVNVLAVEPPLQNVSSLETAEFFAEKKHIINADLENLVSFFMEQLSNVQSQFMDFSKNHPELSKSQPNKLEVKFMLDSFAKAKKNLENFEVKTQEVSSIRESLVSFLDLQIRFRQRTLEVGFEKMQTDPQLLDLLQKGNALDKQTVSQIEALKEKLR